MLDAQFFSVIFSFPTLIFTVLLGLLLLFWLLTILGALDIDALEGLPGFGALHHFTAALGLAGLPFILVVSLLTLCAWALSALGGHYLVGAVDLPLWRAAVGLATLAGSLFLAAYLTAGLLRPLRKLFTVNGPAGQDNLVGKVCTVTTLRVDERFGQARYDDAGSVLVLAVRARVPNSLGKGSRAVIIEYTPEEHTYTVVPYEEIMQ